MNDRSAKSGSNTWEPWILLLMAALTLQGCGPVPSLWGENQSPAIDVPVLIATETTTSTSVPATETFTPVPTFTAEPTSTAILIPTLEPPAARIKHVIVITYDGMRGDAVAAAPMPNLMEMMRNGAYTTTAR